MKKITIVLLLIMPTLINAQFKDEFDSMNKVENPNFNDYDKLVYEATKYIFSNPVNNKSEEFFYAVKIAQFWMDKDTVFPLPTFGTFFSKLTKENNEKNFYIISLMHYNLIQKIDNNRLLKCLPIEGKKFFELPEVKEIQIESAKIFLNYAADENNNFKLNPKLKLYVESMKEGKLESVFFEN
jgi:hypothetical protein